MSDAGNCRGTGPINASCFSRRVGGWYHRGAIARDSREWACLACRTATGSDRASGTTGKGISRKRSNMVTVGIIANPSSGKDIRRIVAQGWVVSNQEKIAIVRRLLRGLEAAGVEHVLFMPESLGIGFAALEALSETSIRAENLPMNVTARQEDSTRAAELMVEQGATCIVTLGGDGTNRAVFKGCGSRVPLLPISTGTNNVFPEFQEGTTAGLAAGLIACGKVPREVACWHSKVLILYKQGIPVDLALVDLAIS